MNVVCFGQQNWDYCWTAKQQLLTRLAQRGHRVLYVNPDLSAQFDGRAQLAALKCRGRVSGVEEVRTGLHVLTQGDVPAWLGPRVRAKIRYWGIRAACDHLQLRAPVALALRPDRLWLMRAASPAAMAYYAVDEWTGFGGLSEASKSHLRAREEELLREVDVAMAVSPRLVERFRQIRPNTHHLENGADVEHFAPAALRRAVRHEALAALRGPRIGFVGQVDERLDQDLLLALADAQPDWNLVLAGRIKPGTDVERLRGVANIHLLGYQPYERLPGVLCGIDVCIVPYHRTELTQSCNPLKVYEYLATGRPVVSVPLDGLLACRDAVTLARTPDEFRDAIRAALADPAAGREHRLSVAAANAWPHRVDRLEQYLEEARAASAARRTAAPRPRGSRPWSSGRSAARLAVRLDAKEESLQHVHYHYRWARLSGLGRVTYLAFRAGGAGYYAVRLAGRLLGRLSGDHAPSGVRKILVARCGFLGDTIAFLPTLAALRRRYPKARIVLAVQPGFGSAAIVESTGYVDEVRPLHFQSEGRAARLRDRLGLFLEGYDLLVTGIWYSMVPDAVYCGAPRHVGLYDGHPLQELCTRVVPLDANRHEADNHLALVEAMGERVDPVSRVPRLTLDEARVRATWERLRVDIGIPGDAEFLVVHPGSKRESRRWPADRFAELTGQLLQRHPTLHAVFTGTAGEADLVEAILERLAPAVRARTRNGIGATDLNSLVALVSAAKLVICNDTGIMHVARARGVPLVAVLGPENDRRWGPYPLGRAPAVTVRAVVPCAPCARDSCPALYCMRSTSVAQVLAAAESVLTGETGGTDRVADGRTPDVRAVPLPVLPESAETIYPGERRAVYRSWHDLADAGFELPKVSIVVVLPTDAAPQDETAEARRQFYRSTAWQPYPSLELVVIERAGASPLDAALPSDPEWSQALPPLKRVRVPAHADLHACIAAGLAAAGGALVLVTRGERALPAERLATDVAVHVRGPAPAPVNAAGHQVYLDQLPQETPECACEITWPRELLAAWLDRPRHDPRTGAAATSSLARAAHSTAAASAHRAATLSLSRLHKFVRGKAGSWRRRQVDAPPFRQPPAAAPAAATIPAPARRPERLPIGDDR